MQEIIEIFQYEWAVRALIASTLVGLMCGVLGCFIVLRNMSLIGDALAHAILPGVVFAFMLVGYSAIGFFTGAVIAGLLTAVGITWIQHQVKTKNDAVVGIVFTTMFSIGVMGISWINRNAGVHLDLQDFLFGTVLGVSNEDLYLTGGIAVYVLLSIAVFYRYLFVTTFQPVIAQTMGISVKTIHYFLMLLLSVAVVASLKTVGVILVVAMLITPASTALLLSNKLEWVLVLSASIGVLSAFIGFLLAVIFETTPGPAMAITATLLYLAAVCFAPERGLLVRYFRRRHLHRKIRWEDTLKQAYRLQQKGKLTMDNLASQLDFSKKSLQLHLNYLHGSKYLFKNEMRLTPQGEAQANRLIRAHRLWETYLVEQMGLTTEQIHEDAEKYEHLLTDELLDEMDKELGFPALDPHGSPIPTKIGLPNFPLSRLDVLAKARIAAQQTSDHIATQLWQLGLLPGMDLIVRKKENGVLVIQQNEQLIRVSTDLARQINIELAEQ